MRPNLRFKNFAFKNAVTYEQAEFPMDGLGVVFWQGDNKDTGGSNGAGKTTPFEILQNTLFDTTAKGAKKGELVREGGNYEADLTFEKGEHSYRIHEFRDHEELGTGIRFYQDDKDISGHASKDTRAAIQKTLGLTLGEFNGCVYLSQNSVHTLIEGKASERRAYISDLFNLDHYDQLFETFDRREKETTQGITERLAAEAKAHNIQERLSKRDPVDWLKQVLAECRTWMGEVNLKLTQSQAEISKTVKNLALADSNEKIQAKLKSLGLTDTEWDNEIAECEAQKKELKQVEARDRVTVHQIAARNKLLKSLAELKVPVQKVELLEAELKVRRDLIRESRKAHADLLTRDKHNKQIADLKSQKNSEDTEALYETCRTEMSELETKFKFISEELESYEAIEGQTSCPTCKQDLDVKSLEEHIAEQVGEAHKIEDRLKVLKTTERSLKEDLKIQKEIDRITATSATLVIPENILSPGGIEEEDTHCGLIERDLKNWVQKSTLDRELAKIPEHTASEVEVEQRLDQTAKDLETVEAEVSRLRTGKELHSHLIELDGTREESAILKSHIEERVELLTGQRERLSFFIAWNESDMAETLELQIQLNTLRKSLEELNDLRQKQRIYQALKKAYHPAKGLKNLKLRRLAQAVVETLPRYVAKLFTEKELQFLIDSEGDGLSFEVSRPGLSPYDIKFLSGGEKKRLTVALVFTLAELVSPHKRSNMIILDEIEGNLDKLGVYMFANELLPSLREKYDTIFVISHSTDISFNNFKEFKIWRCVKEHNISRLEQGYIN